MMKIINVLVLTLVVLSRLSGQEIPKPTTVQEAIYQIDSTFFKDEFKHHLDTIDQREFVNNLQYILNYYSRLKWGVLGGEDLYKSYASSVKPADLGLLLSNEYYNHYSENSNNQSFKRIYEQIGDTIDILPFKKPKYHSWKFKIRDGLEVNSFDFYVRNVSVSSTELNQYQGIFFKPSLNSGYLKLKRDLDKALREYLVHQMPKDPKKSPVDIIVNEFYTEVSITGESTPSMAAIMNVTINTDNSSSSYAKYLIKDLGVVFSGAQINKMFEELLQTILNSYHHSLPN